MEIFLLRDISLVTALLIEAILIKILTLQKLVLVFFGCRIILKYKVLFESNLGVSKLEEMTSSHDLEGRMSCSH